MVIHENTIKYPRKSFLKKHCIYFSFAEKIFFHFFFNSQFRQKKTYVLRRNVAFAIYTGKIHIMFMYTNTTFIPWPFSKIFYAHIWYLSWQGFIHVPVIPALVQCSENEKIMQFIRFSVKSIPRKSRNWFHGKTSIITPFFEF